MRPLCGKRGRAQGRGGAEEASRIISPPNSSSHHGPPWDPALQAPRQLWRSPILRADSEGPESRNLSCCETTIDMHSHSRSF